MLDTGHLFGFNANMVYEQAGKIVYEKKYNFLRVITVCSNTSNKFYQNTEFFIFKLSCVSKKEI